MDRMLSLMNPLTAWFASQWLDTYTVIMLAVV
jgi:hypothetical protein